jgi:hypothetical protein
VADAEVVQTLQDVNTTRLNWTWTLTSGNDATEWHYYLGRASGVYTFVYSEPNEALRTVEVKTFAPDVGEWYCVLRAVNAGGESAASNEVFFVVPSITGTVEDDTGLAVVYQTIQNVTLTSVGRVAVTGIVSQTLEAVTPTATTTVDVKGVVSQTLQSVTGVITAVHTPQADAVVTQTLQDVSLVATAHAFDPAVEVGAWVDALLEDVSATMSGTVEVKATVDKTPQDVTVAATGTVLVVGDVTATMADATLSSQAVVGVVIEVTATLDDVTIVSTGIVEDAPPNINAVVDALLEDAFGTITATSSVPFFYVQQDTIMDGSLICS